MNLGCKWNIDLFSLNVCTFGHVMTTMITDMETEDFPVTLAMRPIDRFAQSSAQVGTHSWKQSRDTEVPAVQIRPTTPQAL